MRYAFITILILLILTGCSRNYYIVRHAEKAQPSEAATMQTTGNPPLSDAGNLRAAALQERLSREKLVAVYSTNTIRTIATATPTARAHQLELQLYARVNDSLLQALKQQKGNVLIVGHSNTVDDLVNGLLGRKELSDLPDAAYDNLFIITRKGKRLAFLQQKFGQPSE